MTLSEAASECPFCAFRPSEGAYELFLHVETHHSEGQSPFAIIEEPVACLQDGCGELVVREDLEYHLELHDLEAKEDAADATEQHPIALPQGMVEESNVKDPREDACKRQHEKQSATIQAWRAFFGVQRSHHAKDSSHRTRHKSKQAHSTEQDSETKAGDQEQDSQPAQLGSQKRLFVRLGKSELGRFAHEKQMPPWLVKLLQEEGQVTNDGVLPVLSQLLEQCPSTQIAYLCHPEVQHISKLRREGKVFRFISLQPGYKFDIKQGGFCGYRNIQMLTSHIIGAQLSGAEIFGSKFPSVFDIQDFIENAWDMGYNAQGRIETGGVKGTRKYIGTPEAQAVFCSLSIPCSVQAFKAKERGKAKALLLEAVERYFQTGVVDAEARIHLTQLPPIYLQHPGHSLTIVGLERQVNGEVNLIVFDPSFRDSTKIRQLVGKVFRHRLSTVDAAVQPYRRGSQYLRKYSAFEVLHLTPTTPAAL